MAVGQNQWNPKEGLWKDRYFNGKHHNVFLCFPLPTFLPRPFCHSPLATLRSAHRNEPFRSEVTGEQPRTLEAKVRR